MDIWLRKGTHLPIKYCLIRVLFFNRELRLADHYLRPQLQLYINIYQPWRVADHSLTAMV